MTNVIRQWNRSFGDGMLFSQCVCLSILPLALGGVSWLQN
jgi:hypothetical protein